MNSILKILSSRVLPLLQAGLLLLACTNATAQTLAGSVVLLAGKASATNNGVTRALSRGEPVYAGDDITTGKNSYLNLLFTDDGHVLLRPKTRFQIDTYNYPAPPVTEVTATPPTIDALKVQQQVVSSEGRTGLRLLKGAFRAITGLIGTANHDNFRVITPVATIGIRGTDFGAFYDEDAKRLSVAVYSGGINLTTDKGKTDVDAGHSSSVDADGNVGALSEGAPELEATLKDDPKNCN